VTVVFLVVLATLGYTLSSRVATRRHRDRYVIDYCKARYACDSALKYAVASLEDLKPELISRPNEPDFSDVFALTEPEYQKLLAQFGAQDANQKTGGSSDAGDMVDTNNIRDTNDANNIGDANDANNLARSERTANLTDSNSVAIRGPYGPPWPCVTQPLDLEVGSAKVKVEIEDENAKYPLGWFLLDDEKIKREAQVSLETFCEWMGFNSAQIDSLKQELEQIREIKPFKLDFKPITKPASPPPTATTPSGTRSRRKTSVQTTAKKTISVSDQVDRQYADFAKLFHSSLIDMDLLARPTVVSESRKESALKYTGLWASTKVNINTAPRHVLEAAFTYGGTSDAPNIAEQIIQRRRTKPFESIEDLRKSLFRYSDSIRKCENFITTASSLLTIKVTAVSGVAKASAVAAVTKEGNKIKPIAVISD